jgi:CRISPR/Cas system CSM-associated protein Csm3 (group 7 of RAMP superfamily)
MSVEIVIRVTMDAPLHISAETKINTEADRALLKQRHGLPYIPATSLKGRLRAELESLLGHFDRAAPRSEGMQHPLTEQFDVDILTELFGSPWMESRLYFSDLHLTREFQDRKIPTTQTRMGVGINPRRGVAQDQHLYSTELFLPGISLTFEGDVLVETSSVEHVALIIAGLKLVERIGSGRSRGLGWCKIEAVQNTYTTEKLRQAFDRIYSQERRI